MVSYIAIATEITLSRSYEAGWSYRVVLIEARELSLQAASGSHWMQSGYNPEPLSNIASIYQGQCLESDSEVSSQHPTLSSAGGMSQSSSRSGWHTQHLLYHQINIMTMLRDTGYFK